mmetsp:Transcript_58327/g.156057  ORF Transcript_58327/g.156057 Transcript_58327/m.156057 type:complete len:220 (-) Transcript_58327:408-1067(-)
MHTLAFARLGYDAGRPQPRALCPGVGQAGGAGADPLVLQDPGPQGRHRDHLRLRGGRGGARPCSAEPPAVRASSRLRAPPLHERRRDRTARRGGYGREGRSAQGLLLEGERGAERHGRAGGVRLGSLGRLRRLLHGARAHHRLDHPHVHQQPDRPHGLPPAPGQEQRPLRRGAAERTSSGRPTSGVAHPRRRFDRDQQRRVDAAEHRLGSAVPRPLVAL